MCTKHSRKALQTARRGRANNSGQSGRHIALGGAPALPLPGPCVARGITGFASRGKVHGFDRVARESARPPRRGKACLRAAPGWPKHSFCPKMGNYALFLALHGARRLCYNAAMPISGKYSANKQSNRGGAMQDPDDSDAAPHDMVLNKAKRNKGIAAPFCTRAAALPLLFSAAWRAVRPPRQRAGAHRPAAGNRFR